jgi:formyl-CoA transferase
MEAASSPTHGPLAGIRVLDLTAVVLGPLATQLLGDCGAEVIKVEPIEGDMMRANGVSRHRGMSSIFMAVNRNKRSLALDLKSPEGVAVLARLAPTVDVFVHNMRPAAIERLGLGYAAVSAWNPGIVYCAAPGFGQDGPDRDKPAFDDIIQAGCGLVSLNGRGHDRPFYTPSLIADKTAGLMVANGVMAALVHKARGGSGQYVEVPMLETLTAFVLAEHLGGLAFEPPPAPAGYARLLAGGRQPAPTQDGWIAMLPYTGAHWAAFFEDMGRPELIEAYSVHNRHERNRHAQALYGHLREITPTRTTAGWMEVCARLDIPATPIVGLDELPEHPHLKAVGLFEEADHPTEGRVRYVRPTTRFAATPSAVWRQAPVVGQHTDEILAEAGYSDDEVTALAGRGVVRRGPPAAVTPATKD